MEYKKILLPDKLCKEAERYIKKVIDALKAADKLNVVDEGAIYILASSYHQYIKATEIVDDQGLIVPGAKNSVVPNPAIRIAKDNKTVCLNIMAQMGLTLKSRTKMNVMESADDKTPLEKFFADEV